MVNDITESLTDGTQKSGYRKESKLLEEQTRLLELIARGKPLDVCLSALCSAIPRLNAGVRASVMFADEERKKFKSPVVTPDFSPSFGEGLEGAPINELFIGTCGTAVYNGKPVQCSDIANDEKWSKEWRDLCIEHDVFACCSSPIFSKDETPLGSFMLAFDEPRKPNEWEQRLAEFGTYIASIAFERARAGEALSRSVKKYRTLFDSMDEGYCIIEMLFDENDKAVDYRFLEVNAAFEKQSGMHNVTGKRMLEFVSDIEEHWLSNYGKVALTGEPVRFANEYKELDRWFDVYAFPVGESESQKIAVLFKDITERKEAEEALRESEERFRAFVTASSDIVYRMSSDWTEMYHLEGRDFIADTHETSSTWLDEYIHPDDQQRVQNAISEAIRTKSIFELEHRIRQVDGTLGWTHSRAIPIFDDDGEIIEWFGAASDVTERKKAEEALAQVTAESEKQRRQYETIFSSTPDLVCVFDLDYRITYANDALLNLWDRTSEETVGKKLFELGFESKRLKKRKREINRVLDTKQTVRGEASFTHPELGERVYDYIFVPVLNSKGEVEAVAGTTRDVTDLKQKENALRKSDVRLRTVLENSEVGVWDLNFENNTAWRSPKHDQIFGYDSLLPEWTYDKFMNHVLPEDREMVDQKFNAVLDNSGTWDFDCRIRRADDALRWIRVRGKVTRLNDDDSSGRMLGTVQDITERKQKQEERERLLREVEAERKQLIEVFQRAPSVMAILQGPDYVFERANEQYMELTGHRELIGKSAREVFPETESQGFFELLDQVYETGEAYEGKDVPVILEPPDGGPPERYFFNFVYQPIRDPEGQVTGIFAQGVDLTERKRAEEELKAVNENLEEKVEERTASLFSYQEQLRSLATQLSRTEEEERRRLATELHDNLGQMLAVTKMKMNAMQKTGSLSGLTETSEMIDEALVYTRKLMSDLKPPPSLGEENISTALEWLAKKMKKYDLNVIFEDIDETKPLDKDVQITLVQTVRELLFNVVKHADTDEAHITLLFYDDHLKITVEDDGSGFDTYRDKPDLSKGGGFGLFNIRERIHVLGGQTDIESAPGEGTKVTLLVPLTAEGAETLSGGKHSRRLQEQQGRQNKQDQAKIKVLLVDDHEMMRKGLKTIIDREDDLTVVAEAPDGQSAIELAREARPDVIIMDINLPGMNGIDATQKIKAELPEIRVIGLSLHDDENVERAIRDVGASAYVSKTEAFETLCATIRSEGRSGTAE